jgi:hypothetical protein
MRNINKVLFILIILFSFSSVNAQFSFGILGGVNLSDVIEYQSSGSTTKDHFGIGAGILGEYRFSNDIGISIQPMYTQKGVNIAYGTFTGGVPQDSISITINFLSVPLLLKVYALNEVIYVSGGFDIAYKLDASLKYIEANTEEDITDSFKDFSVMAVLGVGAQFRLGSNFHIFVDGRYAQSISDIGNSNPDDPEEYNSSFRMASFQLFVGLTYSLGGGKNED